MWLQALWRDLLCVGFARQCWKVYRYDVPKVSPVAFPSLLPSRCLQHSVRSLLSSIDSEAQELSTFMHPVVQVLCSWKAFVTALKSKLFQFWLKFW